MDELTPTPEQRRELSAYEKTCAEACPLGCGAGSPRVERTKGQFPYGTGDFTHFHWVPRMPCSAPSKDTVISGLVREVERLKADLEDITKWIGKDTDHFDYLWSAIVNQPDSVLTGDAIETKRRMLEISGVERYQKAIEAAPCAPGCESTYPVCAQCGRQATQDSRGGWDCLLGVCGAVPISIPPCNCWKAALTARKVEGIRK